ncbi:hypothetical protein [Cytobacillus purgationiresistens]|uniref:SbsC C-terminal domain-containing protein n=1 Tax=Cytobacillus purgationiresistens TaxID=863449 RepID=A0ABU0AEG3_9BACI|nr:hypothetical protein [Cytobacillus purgationiresistens]MDQ0269136.1 hypothetical protein [Cytobacillus purgationiresistens]
MAKKKAIKVAAATAIAASSFAAVAPAVTQAATQSEASKAVEYAKWKMWLPFKELSKTGENPTKEPVWASTVKKLIDEAKAEKAKAQKVLNAYKGSDKKKLQDELNYNDKFVTNAQEYIYARWAGDDLLNKKDWDTVVAEALKGSLTGKYKDIRDLNNLYFDFDNDIWAARKQIDKVFGAENKSALKNWYTEPAYKDHAVLVKDAAWAVHFAEKADWWLNNAEAKKDPKHVEYAGERLAEAKRTLIKWTFQLNCLNLLLATITRSLLNMKSNWFQ